MTKVRFTKVSSNRKVGKMSVTTTERQSCPDACPFKGNGCYADGFPLAGVWNHFEARLGSACRTRDVCDQRLVGINHVLIARVA